MKSDIFVICGPTACGKTPVAIELAKKINGEIISADSMQIYKHMNIGTAKITEAETQGVAHYLIDELLPNEPYNAAVFKRRAADLIKDIKDRGKMPIICGGTGFYINALLFDTNFDNEAPTDCDGAYRAHLMEIASKNGPKYLHEMLRQADAKSAYTIDVNNIKRVVRALEFYKIYGHPISEHNTEQKKAKMAYDAAIFVLNSERQSMYARINKRVDRMMADGLLDEVENLLRMGYSPRLVSMQGLGYKEIVKYLQQNCSLQEAVDAIKQGTRRFAKRQVTWFKHQLPQANWIDVEEHSSYGEVVQCMAQLKHTHLEKLH